ncbi:MAG: PAS domain-containing sensor histidine kinase [Longimicrobiales bacterium]|nr:PAS domain-containing sensor histidine kinase [Longimicrobiales bacterium]
MGHELSKDEFKAVFDAAPDGYLIVAADGTIRAVNPKAEKLFGWSAQELIGQAVEVLLPDRLRDAHGELRAGFVAKPHNRPMGAGLDLRARRRDGSEFPVEISLSPWHRSDNVMVICSVRDVSEVRRLQNFSEGALRATEDERQRIARELHDDTAQRLATLILRVRQMALQPDDARRATIFEEVRQEIVDAADGVRRMSRGLRPPEIEELGLGPSLLAHARTLRESGLFMVTMEVEDVEAYLDQTAKLAVYRIIQEAISNARRHSGADSVRASLRLADGTIIVEVTDRGCGFDPSFFIEGPGGLGLVSMQERASMLGGRLAKVTSPGEGTTIRLVIPIGGATERGRIQDG